MLSAIVEGLLSILLEFVFEAVGEVLSEVGLNFFEKANESRVIGPVIRAMLYVVIGVLLGICSYFLLPVHIVDSPVLRAAGMLVSVFGSGFVLCGVSWFVARKDRHEGFWSTSKFVQGVIFGASYSLTRAFVIG